MRLIESSEAWTALRSSEAFQNKTLGLVHTMGHLHDGHKMLMTRSVAENDLTVLVVFTNPTQFNDPADFENYPRTIEHDVAVAKSANVDYVFIPSYEDMYPFDYRYQMTEKELSRIMEGSARPGHFDGMLSIVLKMLLLIRPHRSYYGEKDYQQYQLIKDMAKAFFLQTEIIGIETIRNENGLAMSSRNSHLSPEEITLAENFPRLLGANLPIAEICVALEELGLAVEYIQDYANRRYGAVRLGKVRLIDNMPLTELVD